MLYLCDSGMDMSAMPGYVKGGAGGFACSPAASGGNTACPTLKFSYKSQQKLRPPETLSGMGAFACPGRARVAACADVSVSPPKGLQIAGWPASYVRVKIGGIMNYGYARVFDRRPEPRLASRGIEESRCQTVFKDEGLSGATTKRPALLRCLKKLEHGDKLIVWKLDRPRHVADDRGFG
jgi:hypothetical protein